MAETTDNQQKYEELFANRFSSDDKEYQQYQNRPADIPPIVENWSRRGGGNRGRGRDRYQDRRGRGWGGDQRGQQHSRDRDRDWDRDRHSGQGSGYQSGPPGYNQGYQSHQRPQYGRY